MHHSVLVAALLFCSACGNDAGKTSSAPATTPQVAPPAAPLATPPSAAPAAADSAAAAVPPAAPPVASPGGHDFTDVGRALLAVGACADDVAPPEAFPADYLAKHCTKIRKVQDDYRTAWVTKARAFFAEKVPGDLPKKVVYPFAGGDLSTALTVYPDADEITTMSLEPAGDPRTLAALSAPPEASAKVAKPSKSTRKRVNAALDKAMETIRYELRFLYKVNFSNTMNMIGAMRAGALPTQLVFGLSALEVHGFEVVALRYFHLDDEGTIVYLTDEEIAAAPAVGKAKADTRNRVFANAEIRFRKPGGRIQIYRHLQVNLDDLHLKKDPRVLLHLAAKGPVAGMTKAASYLLSWNGFSTIRQYLIDHVVWMVSDATGVPPKYGKPAGFEYETYGKFLQPHIGDGQGDWAALWKAQPKRPLPFRFGYHDGSPQHTNHLVIMRKPRG